MIMVEEFVRLFVREDIPSKLLSVEISAIEAFH